MIRTIADFMITPCETIGMVAGLMQVRELFFTKRQDCFPVMEDGQIRGVLTWQDLLEAHPNRIVADAMSYRFTYAEPSMPFWQAREILEQNNLVALLIQERNGLVGLVTPAIIEQELGKHTDLLTDLYRTDYLYYHALELMESGQEMSIIFADINNFGMINKQYGHMKGDLVLKEFSTVLQAHRPMESCLCRFGGDEFIMLMPASREAIAAVAHNLRQVVASYPFSYNIPVTMSVGIATDSKNNDRTFSHRRRLASLINMASLASTAAKRDNSGIKILDQESTGESA